MASFNIHLAIAKLYAERQPVKDLPAFFKGTIEPDLTDDKDATHFGTASNSFENAWVRVKNKVGLAEFLAHNPLDNDLNLGKFLHLVTDQKFFHEFFGKKMLIKTDHNQFSADLYHSYITLNQYLFEHYNLSAIAIDKISDFQLMEEKIQQARDRINDVKNGSNYSPKCNIDTARLDDFIREVACIDLKKLISKYKKSY